MFNDVGVAPPPCVWPSSPFLPDHPNFEIGVERVAYGHSLPTSRSLQHHPTIIYVVVNNHHEHFENSQSFEEQPSCQMKTATVREWRSFMITRKMTQNHPRNDDD
jgi:hypothetical protein